MNRMGTADPVAGAVGIDDGNPTGADGADGEPAADGPERRSHVDTGGKATAGGKRRKDRGDVDASTGCEDEADQPTERTKPASVPHTEHSAELPTKAHRPISHRDEGGHEIANIEDDAGHQIEPDGLAWLRNSSFMRETGRKSPDTIKNPPPEVIRKWI